MKKGNRSRDPFLQPLALAGVCFVFMVILFGLAAIDFRTLDKSLRGYAERRGLDFIRTVRQAAGFNLQQMNREMVPGKTGFMDFDDRRLSLQESLVLLILQLAQRIDDEVDNGTLAEETLGTWAARQGLWNLAIFDPQGKVIFKKRSVPDSVENVVSKMIRDHGDLEVRIFDNGIPPGALRFFALRRKHNNGFVVLFFDRGAYHFWKMKTALEMAVDAVGLPADTDCFFIRNRAGSILVQSGNCGAPSVAGAPPEAAHEAVVWNGRKAVMLVRKIPLDDGAPLTAYLILDTDDLDRMIRREKVRGMTAIGLMVLLVVLSMGFLYRNQRRHIAGIREMERRLQQSERLSAMGRLASGVAHEIRNPLNAISMASQRLRADNLQPLTTVIRNEIKRLNLIIEEFLGLSGGRPPKPEKGDLADLIRQVGLLMGEESRLKGVGIETKGTETSFMMFMDGDKIKQALINMVKNAVEAISGPGTVTLALRPKEDGTAVISISDTGTGLAEKDAGKIFNPDYTTKEKGLGLGLALAHEIILAHGGEIKVENRPGMGTTFLIRIPAAAATD